MNAKYLLLTAFLAAFCLVARSATTTTVPAGTTITCPAQASAVGFTNMVFDDEFTTANTFTTSTTATGGYNWYPYFWVPATSASQIKVTTTAGTGSQTGATGYATLAGGNISTIVTSPGQGGPIPGSYQHAYFEARIQFNPKQSSANQTLWPAFWSFGSSAFIPTSSATWLTTQSAENDFIEAYPLGGTSYFNINTLHNWQHNSNSSTGTDVSNTDNENEMLTLVGSTASPQATDGGWHTYGCLWVATSATNGYVQYYYDNYLVAHQNGITQFLTGAGTNLPAQELDNMVVIMGSSSKQPMNVDWVRIWQSAATIGITTPSGTLTQTLTGFTSTLSLSTTQSPYTLPATTSAGLTPNYSVASGPATVSSNTLTLTGAGTVVVNATQVGDSINAPFSASETITVTTPGIQTIANFPATLNLSMPQSPYTLPATTSTGLTVTYQVSSGPASVSSNTLTLTGPGTVVVVASQPGDMNDVPYSGSETINVTQLTQTLDSFPATLTLSPAQSPYAFTANTSSNLPVTYQITSGPATATISSNTLTFTDDGTYVISATQAGDANDAPYAGTETLTVSQLTQTIANFPSTLSLTTDLSPYTLTPNTSSNLPVTYQVDSGPASVSSNTLTLSGTGTVVLEAIQAGDANDSPYDSTETITLSLPLQTIANFPSTVSLTMGQSPYTLPATSSVGLTINYSVTSGPANVSGNTLTFSDSGTVVLLASQDGSGTYTPLSLTETITMAALIPQTVSNFPPTMNLLTTQTPYLLPAMTSASLPLSYSMVSGPAAVSSNTLTLSGPGTVVLTASQAGTGIYAPYSGSEAITVTAVTQTIANFPGAMTLTAAQTPDTLPATTSAGLTLNYSVTGPATVSGNTLTLTGAGTVVVTASQAGNATYAPLSAIQTITVTPLTTQTVSNFPATSTYSLGSGPVTLPATTSVGYAITYQVVSGPATINGNTLTITGTGTVVVSATQAGDLNNSPFSATETITVSPSATLTFSQWEAGYFTATQLANTAVSGPTATPQNDGVPNLLKYLYDINPTVGMAAADYAAMPVTDVDTTTKAGTTYLTLTYRQYTKITGITVSVQTSPDLQTWTTVTPAISRQVGTDPVTGDPLVEDEVNTNGATTEFIRLNVTSP